MNKSYQIQHKHASQWSKSILSILFIAILSGMLIINILTPDLQMSETENRFLRQIPVLSLNSLLNGSFSKKFEEYISDQFFLRNAWVTTKTTSQLILGRRDNNGVYYGKDGRLYEMYVFDEKILTKNLNALEQFVAKTGLPAAFLPAPSASYIQPKGLPKYVYSSVENALWKETFRSLPSLQIIESIDILQSRSDEYLYYYSDHHWTTLGAYYAYTALMDAWGIPPRQIGDYLVSEASSDFLGALHSKSGYRYVKPDTITLFDPKVEVIVAYSENGRKTRTLFEPSKLATKDQYSVFMDGNHPLVTIKSTQGQGKLLVLKDSFAHSLIPLMAGQFEEIHMIDLRYFKGSVFSYVADNHITGILALYSATSLGSQPFISQLR